MEQNRRPGDYHVSLPLVRRSRVVDYHGTPLPPRECPRCQSNDTKFSYFNNYKVNQPRYYCRTCKRYWTHGGTQQDIPKGGRSHKGKRSTRRHENQRIQLAALPSPPQLQPLNPSAIVASPAFISPIVPPMMTPYQASGGFSPPMMEEEIAQLQQFEAKNGYLNWVNPLNIVDQSFPQLTNGHSDSCMENYRLTNSEASSSNIVPLDTSMGKISTTNGGTNVSWDSSFVDLDEWLDFPIDFSPLRRPPTLATATLNVASLFRREKNADVLHPRAGRNLGEEERNVALVTCHHELAHATGETGKEFEGAAVANLTCSAGRRRKDQRGKSRR
nr:dof zinc finger protein DOF5.6-like [Ipomoea trifida]